MALFNGIEVSSLGPVAKALCADLTAQRYPDTTGSFARHLAAVHTPRPGFESAILGMLLALAEYADAHAKGGSDVGEDGYAGDEWRGMVASVRALLTCERGRLDGATLDRAILNMAEMGGAPLNS